MIRQLKHGAWPNLGRVKEKFSLEISKILDEIITRRRLLHYGQFNQPNIL